MREVQALSSHYPVSTKSPADHARWLSDFADDLGDLGGAAVAKACRAYRLSDAKRFPTPGQLRKLALERLPSSTPTERFVRWEPATQERYAAMSLSEKVDENMRLASAARHKAGPMWGKFGPLTPEQLPRSWHAGIARAQSYEAEASRLRKVLHAVKDRQDEERGAA